MVLFEQKIKDKWIYSGTNKGLILGYPCRICKRQPLKNENQRCFFYKKQKDDIIRFTLGDYN